MRVNTIRLCHEDVFAWLLRINRVMANRLSHRDTAPYTEH